MNNINPKVSKYYYLFKQGAIKAKDIDEEKIFGKRNWVYIKRCRAMFNDNL